MGAVEDQESPGGKVKGVVAAAQPEGLKGEALAIERVALQAGLTQAPTPDVVVSNGVVDRERTFRLEDGEEGIPLGLGLRLVCSQRLHDAVAGIEDGRDRGLQALGVSKGPGEAVGGLSSRKNMHVCQVGEAEGRAVIPRRAGRGRRLRNHVGGRRWGGGLIGLRSLAGRTVQAAEVRPRPGWALIKNSRRVIRFLESFPPCRGIIAPGSWYADSCCFRWIRQLQ